MTAWQFFITLADAITAESPTLPHAHDGCDYASAACQGHVSNDDDDDSMDGMLRPNLYRGSQFIRHRSLHAVCLSAFECIARYAAQLALSLASARINRSPCSADMDPSAM